MFKLTRGGNGYRRASGGGRGNMPSRVSWPNGSMIRNASAPMLTRGAFVPQFPQDQTRDYDGPRVDEWPK